MSHRLPTGLVLGLTLAGLATGGRSPSPGRGDAADAALAATAAIALVPLTWSVGRSLVRRDVGVDLIALLAIAAALALGEYLAAAVVALMMSRGEHPGATRGPPVTARSSPPSSPAPRAPPGCDGRGPWLRLPVDEVAWATWS